MKKYYAGYIIAGKFIMSSEGFYNLAKDNGFTIEIDIESKSILKDTLTGKTFTINKDEVDKIDKNIPLMKIYQSYLISKRYVLTLNQLLRQSDRLMALKDLYESSIILTIK